MGKYYFIIGLNQRNSKRPESFVYYGTYKSIRLLYKNKVTRISRGFDSLEKLYKEQQIPEWRCTKCGGLVGLHYYNKEQLIEHKLCQTCLFFFEQKKAHSNNPKKIVVEGDLYTMSSSDNDSGGFKGYGGRTFKIRCLKTGKITECNNLWHQGTPPEIWKDEFPNTHEFIND